MNISKYFIYACTSIATVAVGVLFAIYIGYDRIPNSIQIAEAHRYHYDYIIVGAGTCGSVLANRLSNNNNITILLIEAGKQFGFWSVVPMLSTFMQQTNEDWSFQSTPQKYSSLGLLDKKQFLPRGKGLGGSSQLNYLLHFDGSKQDFDRWVMENDAIHFNYEAMKNYLKPLDNKTNFSEQRKKIKITTTPIDVTESGFARILKDYSREVNDKDIDVKLAAYQTYNGIRWSVYHNYLRPSFERKNLKILTNTRINKILFDYNGHVSAVQISPDNDWTTIYNISTNMEVILCAGAYGTPYILKLSGIGSEKELEKFNIKTLHESPEIGNNLHDHLTMPIYVSINESISITKLKMINIAEIFKYLIYGKGIYANFGVAGVIKNKRNEFGVTLFGMGSIDERLMRPLANYRKDTFRGLFPNYHNWTQEGFVLLCTCYQPRSRGSVNLNHNQPYISPSINPNYLHNSYDLNCTINALHLAIELVYNSLAFQHLKPKIHWPQLKECQNYDQTFYNSYGKQLPGKQYLDCIIRHGAVTAHHPGGTCAIGHRTNNAPLDNQMRLRGVTGVRVVDASIFPTPISGTPNSILVAIAEKAANIILSDYLHNGKN